MPQEDRLIIFDYPEVYKSIYSLCVQKDIKKPPQGYIESVGHPSGDTSRIILNLFNETDETNTQVEYSRDFFAAALMLYCRGLGIPLPKSASKSVSIRDGEVALRVRIG